MVRGRMPLLEHAAFDETSRFCQLDLSEWVRGQIVAG
jgi:hypothetical protein